MAASPEHSRPSPLSTGVGPARCIAPFHPRGPQMERRHSLIKLRVPVLDWQLHFPGVLRVPESSTCTDGVSIPVETGRPPFLEDREALIVIREARSDLSFRLARYASRFTSDVLF